MGLEAFDVDCSQRSCRTYVLACAATDTPVFIDSRDAERVLVRRVFANHSDSMRRAVSGTVSTAYIVCVDDTVVVIYDCDTDLDR